MKGAQLSLTVNGTTIVSLPKTGGWQSYKAVQLSVTLSGTENRIELKCRRQSGLLRLVDEALRTDAFR